MIPNNLPVGTKIRCIDPTVHSNSLKENEIYTVFGYSDDEMVIVESGGAGWFTNRFELVEPVTKPSSEWKAGDTVKCIDDTGCTDWLTLSKNYILTSIFATVVAITDDNGDIRSVFKSRFEWVSSPTDEPIVAETVEGMEQVTELAKAKPETLYTEYTVTRTEDFCKEPLPTGSQIFLSGRNGWSDKTIFDLPVAGTVISEDYRWTGAKIRIPILPQTTLDRSSKEWLTTPAMVTEMAEAKLELSAGYWLTAGGYVIELDKHLIATTETSPGVNSIGKTAKEHFFLEKRGWCWTTEGEWASSNTEWKGKLRIVEKLNITELPKLPEGYQWAGGFPQYRVPVKGRDRFFLSDYTKSVDDRDNYGPNSYDPTDNFDRRFLVEPIQCSPSPTKPAAHHFSSKRFIIYKDADVASETTLEKEEKMQKSTEEMIAQLQREVASLKGVPVSTEASPSKILRMTKRMGSMLLSAVGWATIGGAKTLYNTISSPLVKMIQVSSFLAILAGTGYFIVDKGMPAYNKAKSMIPTITWEAEPVTEAAEKSPQPQKNSNGSNLSGQ